MGNFIAGMVLASFVALCAYSWNYHSPTKMVTIWRDEKSATIASIFDISPDELNTATDIFTKN